MGRIIISSFEDRLETEDIVSKVLKLREEVESTGSGTLYLDSKKERDVAESELRSSGYLVRKEDSEEGYALTVERRDN